MGKLNLNRILICVLLVICSFLLFHKDRSKHWLGFNQRETSLALRLRESEDQVRWLGRQLRLSLSKEKKSMAGRSTGVDDKQSCETIHVCIVCSGYNASRTVVSLLKSILYYRKNPLVFHFISDHSARKVLNHLASTWNLSHVQFIFYKAESVINDVSWIPNKHYSGVYGLLKLTLPRILPSSLEKTIVLDTDVVFATDIGRLWAFFKDFNSFQALGLVENQSDWYIPGKLWKNHRPWPALGRGFNTGVILMDLRRLRSMNWWTLWRSVTENNLMTLLSTSLADQDIINTVISRQESIVYTLPCSWNIQLSDNSLSDSLCLENIKDVNVVHFNSPNKFKTRQSYSQFFRNLHQTFLQLDGNLLRGGFFYCDTNSAQASSPTPTDSCASMRQAGSTVYRTHLYYLDFVPTNDSVTLVATLSHDRLHVLEGLVTRWKGPMSLTLYLTDYEAVKFLDFHENSPVLKSRTNVAYHVVYKEGWFYPVNYLRNVAKRNAQTQFVFLSDIDFLPSDKIEENLAIHVANLLQKGEKNLLVVPAFESERYRVNTLPGTKAEVLKLLDLGEIITFRSRVWPQGHEATNFIKWKGSTQPYQVHWKPDFEPYIVAPRNISDYDLRFIGFGWNKVSHILQLHNQGYKFWVLPNVFIVHLPHTPSLDIHRYRTSGRYRDCMEKFKTEFIQEMSEKYPQLP